MDAKRLLPLIGGVYDAALDPGSWPDALGNAAGFVGGSAAALSWKDAARTTGGVHHDDGCSDPVHKQLCFEKCVAFDPSTLPSACDPDHSQPASVRLLDRSLTRA